MSAHECICSPCSHPSHGTVLPLSDSRERLASLLYGMDYNDPANPKWEAIIEKATEVLSDGETHRWVWEYHTAKRYRERAAKVLALMEQSKCAVCGQPEDIDDRHNAPGDGGGFCHPFIAEQAQDEPEVWAVDAPYGTVFACASRELAEEMAATYQDGKVRRLAYHREKPKPLPCSECGRE